MARAIQAVGAVIRFRTCVEQQRLVQLAQALRDLDGITQAELSDHHPLLRVDFDPYQISGKDILKWFALHAVSADIRPPDPEPQPI